jgi:hypothetical protein
MGTIKLAIQVFLAIKIKSSSSFFFFSFPFKFLHRTNTFNFFILSCTGFGILSYLNNNLFQTFSNCMSIQSKERERKDIIQIILNYLHMVPETKGAGFASISGLY